MIMPRHLRLARELENFSGRSTFKLIADRRALITQPTFSTLKEPILISKTFAVLVLIITVY